MKKLICAILAVLLVAGAFVSCSKEKKPFESKKDTQIVESADADDKGDKPEAPVESVPAESVPVDTEEYELGVVNGNTYTNSFVGIGFELPEGWRFCSDEEIRELNGVATDLMGEEYEELLKNSGTFFDMIALDDLGSQVNITVEKASASAGMIFEKEEDFHNKEFLDMQKSAYEGLGFENISITPCKKTVDGVEFYGLEVCYEYMGVAIECIQLIRICGGYNVTITLTNAQSALEGLFIVE